MRNEYSFHSKMAVAKRRIGGDDKRQAILVAALELFNERTYGGTPMPMVAERAGVGAGTIYRYFASKEALVNAVYRDCKLALQRCLAARTATGHSAREEFSRLWQGLWDFARQRPEALRFLETHNHASYLDEASREVSEAVFVTIGDLVGRARAEGLMRRSDPAVLIAMAFGAFVGLVKEADQGHFELTDDLIRTSEDAVWALLQA
jgi:AcrR family transcriptional regulator